MKLAGALADARSQSSLPLGVDAVQPQPAAVGLRLVDIGPRACRPRRRDDHAPRLGGAHPRRRAGHARSGARGVQLTMRSVPRRTVVSCPRWLQG